MLRSVGKQDIYFRLAYGRLLVPVADHLAMQYSATAKRNKLAIGMRAQSSPLSSDYGRRYTLCMQGTAEMKMKPTLA